VGCEARVGGGRGADLRDVDGAAGERGEDKSMYE